MTMDELMEYILREIPEAVFGEDTETGEIVIATGLVQTKADELRELTKQTKGAGGESPRHAGQNGFDKLKQNW